MKTFLIFFFLTLAVGTSLIGWLYFTDRLDIFEIQYTSVTERETYEENLKKNEDANQEDIDIYNKAMKEKNGILCSKIKDLTKRTDCEDMIFAMYAIQKREIAVCASVKNTDTRQKCHDGIALEIAKEKQDKSICATITDTGSQSYCAETIDEAKLRALLSAGSATEELCESLEEKFQEACTRSIVREKTEELYTQAIAGNSRENCELIPLEEERTTCLDTIALREALSKGDIALCATISAADKKAYCEKTLDKKNDAEKFKQYIANNDLTGCQALADVSLQGRCHDSIVFNLVRVSKDNTLCSTMTNTGMIVACQKLAE